MSYEADPRLQPAVVAAATAAAAAAAASNIDPARRPLSNAYESPGAKRAKVVDPNQYGTGQPDEYGNHPDGSWTCPHCGNVNWPRRTVCNNKRCMRPKIEGATAPMDAGTPPGSWVCPLCQNVNWPRRTVCNRCKSSKGIGMGGPPGLPMGVPPPAMIGGPHGGLQQLQAPGNGIQHPPGSWACPDCDNINWPKRTVCNKNGCDTKRPEPNVSAPNMSAPNMSAPIMSAPNMSVGLHLQTQIQALQMLAMQDPANANVYLAQLQQLQAAGDVGAPAASSGGIINHNGIQHPPGSWACPDCDNINWPKRTVCNRSGCNTPRPASAGIPPSQEIGGAGAAAASARASTAYPDVGGYGGSFDVSYPAAGAGLGAPLALGLGPPVQQSQQNHPAGSWVCHTCQNINWPMRTVCNRRGCDTVRPPQ